MQASAPAIHLSLSRVGVTNVEKVIRIGPRGAEQLYHARLDCFVELGPDRKGAHVSRFDEVVNDVIGEVVLGPGGFKAEQIAQRIAVEVRERQDALRAEVTIAARYPEHKPAPVSGIATQEIYTLLGTAVASERGTRRLVGVAAQGMTASPRAQRVVAEHSRERLAADGFSDDQIAAHLRGRAGGDARPARPGHAPARAARGVRHGRGRGRAARDRRGLDVQRDLRADEALRRGRGGREGRASSAARGGLRARGDSRRARALRRPGRRRLRRGAPGEPRDDPAAQRRRRALRACSASCAATAREHTTMREWLSAAGSSRRRGS